MKKIEHKKDFASNTVSSYASEDKLPPLDDSSDADLELENDCVDWCEDYFCTKQKSDWIECVRCTIWFYETCSS